MWRFSRWARGPFCCESNEAALDLCNYGGRSPSAYSQDARYTTQISRSNTIDTPLLALKNYNVYIMMAKSWWNTSTILNSVLAWPVGRTPRIHFYIPYLFFYIYIKPTYCSRCVRNWLNEMFSTDRLDEIGHIPACLISRFKCAWFISMGPSQNYLWNTSKKSSDLRAANCGEDPSYTLLSMVDIFSTIYGVFRK